MLTTVYLCPHQGCPRGFFHLPWYRPQREATKTLCLPTHTSSGGWSKVGDPTQLLKWQTVNSVPAHPLESCVTCPQAFVCRHSNVINFFALVKWPESDQSVVKTKNCQIINSALTKPTSLFHLFCPWWSTSLSSHVCWRRTVSAYFVDVHSQLTKAYIVHCSRVTGVDSLQNAEKLD